MHQTHHRPRACKRAALCGMLDRRLYALAPDHPDRPELERTLAALQSLPCLTQCEDSRGALNCAIADDQPILPTLRGEGAELEPEPEPEPECNTITINY